MSFDKRSKEWVKKKNEGIMQRCHDDEEFRKEFIKVSKKYHGGVPNALLKYEKHSKASMLHNKVLGTYITKETIKAYIYIILIFIILKFITVF